MTRIEKIRELIYDTTNGLVSLPENICNQLIFIVEHPKNVGSVTMFRWDSNNKIWQKVRIIQIEDSEIIKRLNKYANSLNYNFYKYDCTLSTGSFAGTVYTSNNNAFETF